jgi:hypothetical protein
MLALSTFGHSIAARLAASVHGRQGRGKPLCKSTDRPEVRTLAAEGCMNGIYPQKDGSVFVDGAVVIRDLNRAMAWTLPDENATTIAGLLICEAAAIPEIGQAFIFFGYRFEVACKSGNRITGLKVTPRETESWSRATFSHAEAHIPPCRLSQNAGLPLIAKAEELRFDNNIIRVTSLEGLWWVFCADAAFQIDRSLGAEGLFAHAPESERRITRTEVDPCVYLVSASYLLFRFGRSETSHHYRFRAWLRAWKTVTEAGAISREMGR